MKLFSRKHIIMTMFVVMCSMFCTTLSSQKVEAEENTKCVEYNYSYVYEHLNTDGYSGANNYTDTNTVTAELPKICVKLDDEGKVIDDGLIVIENRGDEVDDYLNFSIETEDTLNDLRHITSSMNTGHGNRLSIECNASNVGCDDIKIEYSEIAGKTWEEAVGVFANALNNQLQTIDSRESDVKNGSIALIDASTNNVVNLSDPANGTQQTYDEFLDSQGITNPDNPTSGDTQDGGEQTDDGDDTPSCYSAAGALGWIVCTITNAASSASGGIYKTVLEPYLRVDPTLIDTSEGSAYPAWQTFQTLANLAFVIMLIIVVFSQLTGIGIDNYGIKRILPRLVIAIILINLSYIVCQVAVDVSNIIGGAIQGFFDALSDDMARELSNEPILSESITLIDFSNGFTALAVIISLVVGFFALKNFWQTYGEVAVAMLGLAALTVFFSLVMLFVILAVRQAAVLILTVISPVAFVCYMLPNTRNLFEKWFKLGKSMLVLYPLCSLVMGAGSYAGLIIIRSASDNILLIVAGVVVSIAPIFTIPSLLRKSMYVLGDKAGKMLAGLSKAIPNMPSNAIRNSERYKDWSSGVKERREGEHAGDIQKGIEAKISKETQRLMAKEGLSEAEAKRRAKDKFAKTARAIRAANTYKNYTDKQREREKIAFDYYGGQDTDDDLFEQAEGQVERGDHQGLAVTLARIKDRKRLATWMQSQVMDVETVDDQDKLKRLKTLSLAAGHDEKLMSQIAGKNRGLNQVLNSVADYEQALNAHQANPTKNKCRSVLDAYKAAGGSMEVADVMDASSAEFANQLVSGGISVELIDALNNSKDQKVIDKINSDPKLKKMLNAASAAIDAGCLDGGNVDFRRYLREQAGISNNEADINTIIKGVAKKRTGDEKGYNRDNDEEHVDVSKCVADIGADYAISKTPLYKLNSAQFEQAKERGMIRARDVEAVFDAVNNGDADANNFLSSNSKDAQEVMAMRNYIRDKKLSGDTVLNKNIINNLGSVGDKTGVSRLASLSSDDAAKEISANLRDVQNGEPGVTNWAQNATQLAGRGDAGMQAFMNNNQNSSLLKVAALVNNAGDFDTVVGGGKANVTDSNGNTREMDFDEIVQMYNSDPKYNADVRWENNRRTERVQGKNLRDMTSEEREFALNQGQVTPRQINDLIEGSRGGDNVSNDVMMSNDDASRQIVAQRYYARNNGMENDEKIPALNQQEVSSHIRQGIQAGSWEAMAAADASDRAWAFQNNFVTPKMVSEFGNALQQGNPQAVKFHSSQNGREFMDFANGLSRVNGGIITRADGEQAINGAMAQKLLNDRMATVEIGGRQLDAGAVKNYGRELFGNSGNSGNTGGQNSGPNPGPRPPRSGSSPSSGPTNSGGGNPGGSNSSGPGGNGGIGGGPIGGNGSSGGRPTPPNQDSHALDLRNINNKDSTKVDFGEPGATPLNPYSGTNRNESSNGNNGGPSGSFGNNDGGQKSGPNPGPRPPRSGSSPSSGPTNSGGGNGNSEGRPTPPNQDSRFNSLRGSGFNNFGNYRGPLPPPAK